MRKISTGTDTVKRVKISDETRQVYEQRDRSLDADPDAPTLPLEMWENATVGKYYRPVKTQISVRIDNEVIDWLKAQGDGHLSRINQFLRERMEKDRRG